MPLKAIFNKAPLFPLQQVALSHGQVRATMKQLDQLYALCLSNLESISVLEGCFSLACLLKEQPLTETVSVRILDLLGEQREDGSFDFSVNDQVALLRAALRVFEYNTDKSILEKAAKWCSWLEVNWDSLILQDDLRQHPADLMELLVQVYRITGIKPILRLCSRVRSQAMDWTGVLVSFDQRTGLKKSISLDNLHLEMDKENRHESGYYTRRYLSNVACYLADGIRYSVQCSLYSGNKQEMNAGEKFWSFAKKYHYAVCGGTTADRVLQGMGTHRAIDSVAVGAWAEAFSTMIRSSRTPFIAGDLMDLINNALVSLISSDVIPEYQRVNTLTTANNMHCYDPEEKECHAINVIARLSRAIGSIYHSAVTATEEGISINLMIPGRYHVSIAGHPCLITIGDNTVTITNKEPVKACIHFVAPCDTDVRVNEESAYRIANGTRAAIVRDWNNGDTIKTETADGVGLFGANHQSLYVKKGNTVYALPADEDHFAYAICGEPVERDNKVYCTFTGVKEWKSVDGIPANVSVLPETDGQTIEMEMKPYAVLQTKITVFPKGKK